MSKRATLVLSAICGGSISVWIGWIGQLERGDTNKTRVKLSRSLENAMVLPMMGLSVELK